MSWQASTINGWNYSPQYEGNDNPSELNGSSDIYLWDDEVKENFGCLFADTDERPVLTEDVIERNIDRAKLISAAPELLEALQCLMSRVAKDAESYAQEGNEPIWAFIEDANDAICKAKGEGN